jgi:hypothetical protein
MLDGGSFAACSSPQSYPGPLAAGSHTFSVEAKDAAGNIGPATSYTWTIDTTPPAAPTITSHPPHPSNSHDASFAFTDGEPGVTFLCKVDGGSYAACSSPKTYAALADGSHTFSVEAVDAAGNVSGAASFTWTVDTVTPPQPTIVSHPNDPDTSTTATFAFSDTEAGVTYACKLDPAPVYSPCSNPQTYTGLALGQHAIHVHAVDAAGNSSTDANFSWKIIAGAGQPYTMSASVSPALHPGGPTLPIDISFNSSNNGNNGSGANGTQVSNLTVSISSVTGGSPGPNACTAADFSLAQIPAGAYPFYVPFGVSSLSSLVNPAQLPTIRMINRLDTVPGNGTGNQNACRSATVHLNFAGTP